MDPEGIGRASDYKIAVHIPEGAQTDLSLGRSVRVTLPIVHDQQTHAVVESIQGSEIGFRLSGQVQELNGQEVRVEIVLQPRGLFKIPFNAVYSPRGNPVQTFIVSEGRAQARDLKIVALASPTEIWVAGPLDPRDEVIVQGLDNLISGDAVKAVTPEGDIP